MDTKYNPLRRGKAFNEDINAPAEFESITEQDRQEAEDRLQDLIDQTHEDLGLKEDN